MFAAVSLTLKGGRGDLQPHKAQRTILCFPQAPVCYCCLTQTLGEYCHLHILSLGLGLNCVLLLQQTKHGRKIYTGI